MMKFEEKIVALRDKIEEQLLPVIDNDYVLWDCPYYSNIGDVLIWEGERSFLNQLPYRCLGYASNNTCTFPPLSSEVIILLQGGGNFGDLWRCSQDFRLKVIRHYPHNRIIIFPQSVCYQDVLLMTEDSRVMAEHPQLIICARDQVSYTTLKQNFQNTVLLVPDMAFYISSEILAQYRKKEQEKILFLKRSDKELASAIYDIEEKKIPVEVRDWPTMEKEPFYLILLYIQSAVCRYLRKWKTGQWLVAWITDQYALKVCRLLLLKRGIGFVSGYKSVYTTRLHVMILSVLLHKNCCFFDNSYGKNKNLYATWLSDVEGCKEVL